MLDAITHAMVFYRGNDGGCLTLLRKAFSVAFVDDDVLVCVFTDVDVDGAKVALDIDDVNDFESHCELLAYSAQMDT